MSYIHTPSLRGTCDHIIPPNYNPLELIATLTDKLCTPPIEPSHNFQGDFAGNAFRAASLRAITWPAR